MAQASDKIFDVTVNGKPWKVAVEPAGEQGQVQVTVRGRRHTFDVSWVDAGTLSLIPLDGDARRTREFGIERRGARELQITAGSREFRVTVLSDGKSHQRQSSAADRTLAVVEGRQSVVATMPGRIVRVLVGAGDRVTAGQAVVVVEAMKMENEMRAPKDGAVREVRVQPGEAIDAGAVLVVID